MDNLLYKIFKAIPDEPIPSGIHGATMRRVLFLRSYKIVTVVAVAICASFAFSLWHLYVRLVELDFLTTAKAVFSTFEFDINSVVEAFQAMTDFTPVGAATVSLLNLIAFGFVLYLLSSFKRMRTLYF